LRASSKGDLSPRVSMSIAVMAPSCGCRCSRLRPREPSRAREREREPARSPLLPLHLPQQGGLMLVQHVCAWRLSLPLSLSTLSPLSSHASSLFVSLLTPSPSEKVRMEHAEVTREKTEAVKVQLLSLFDVSSMMSRILANRCVSVSVSVSVRVSVCMLSTVSLSNHHPCQSVCVCVCV
jgi:hypothetical protein